MAPPQGGASDSKQKLVDWLDRLCRSFDSSVRTPAHLRTVSVASYLFL
jgi:hypothetical protein